jgi:PAS domain S-box-containing protein
MANPAAERMFRFPIDQLVGAPVERLIPARYRARHRLQVEAFGDGEVNARPMGARREVIGLRSDGEEFPIETSISHLHLDGQRLYTAILRDVSDSRRAEAALRDSEARLRQLLALLPDAVFVNSGGRIAFVNEAASRLFGADESALLGRLVLELIHPDSIEQVRTRVAALHGGATMVPPVELKVLRADGAVRSVESTDTRFVDHEEVSLIVVLRDVTELRQAQTALRESHADLQRLVEAQNSVQEDERKRIARELHDDLQQTLASIAINVAAIGERLPPDAAAAVPVLAEVGQLATAAIESTRRIVNDLRPQILEDLGLVPALEVMADQFERRSGMSCQLELDADAGDRVLASPAITTCLYRVTQESLNNVAKHARASLVRIDLTGNADGSVALRVADDGQGIDAKDRRKLDSFGLLGMQERVRAVGGRLRVESQPGGGTTVEVVVPLVGAVLEA